MNTLSAATTEMSSKQWRVYMLIGEAEGTFAVMCQRLLYYPEIRTLMTLIGGVVALQYSMMNPNAIRFLVLIDLPYSLRVCGIFALGIL